MNRDEILNMIQGKGTDEEREAFFRQVVENEELARVYAQMKNEYVMRSLPCRPGDVALRERRSKPAFFTILTRVAAILFIPLLAYITYDRLSRPAEAGRIADGTAPYQAGAGVRYTVNAGVKASLVLPDSSRVWLNSMSTLDIPHDFGAANRKVFLSGEGYFAVQSDVSSPFWVNTMKDIAVKVTGTEFNLSCYDNDDNMKLTLFSGSLELIKATDEIINVHPNEQIVVYYATLKEKFESLKDVEYASAWKEGNLRFENTPMDEVLRKLERWYGVHITVDDPAIWEYSFTADFESESLSQVLDLMKISTAIHYRIDSNKVKLYTALL